MNTPRLVVIDGVRTPFSKMGTDLARVGAEELGRMAVNALLTKTGLNPSLVDEVIFGCVAQPADAANIARVIALRAGIPEAVPAFTVHRNCASGRGEICQARPGQIASPEARRDPGVSAGRLQTARRSAARPDGSRLRLKHG